MSRHGENIRKRTDGRWEGRYRYKTSDGTYKFKYIYGKTYCEVKESMNIISSCFETENKVLQENQQAKTSEC